MRAHGHTWDGDVLVESSTRGLLWLQRLWERMSAYSAERRRALVIRYETSWNARHEVMRKSPSLSALESAAGQGGPAMAMTLYTAHTDMACTG